MPKTTKASINDTTTLGAPKKNKAGVVAYYPPKLYPKKAAAETDHNEEEADDVPSDALAPPRKARKSQSQPPASTKVPAAPRNGKKGKQGNVASVYEDLPVTSPLQRTTRSGRVVHPYARPTASSVSKQAPVADGAPRATKGAQAKPVIHSPARAMAAGAFSGRVVTQAPQIVHTPSTSYGSPSIVSPPRREYTPLSASKNASSPTAPIKSPAASTSRGHAPVVDDAMDVEAVEQVNSIRGEERYSDELKQTFLGKKYLRVAEAGSEAGIYLVLDTNFLVGPMGIQLLEQMDNDNFSNVRIKIPHVVFVELDKLKERGDVVEAARNAIRYLNDRFVQRADGRILGQSVEDYRRGFHSSVRSNDDHILECFRQVSASTGKAVLVTDDRNLQTRTAINAPSVSRLSSVRSSKQLKDDINHHLNGHPSIFTLHHSNSVGSNDSFDSEDDLMVVEPPSDSAPVQPVGELERALGSHRLPFADARLVIDCLETMTKIVLEDMLKSHAKKRFGMHWVGALETPLPWETLDVIIGLICQFRTGVFLDILKPEDEGRFEQVLTAVKAAEKTFAIRDICHLVLAIQNLFTLLKQRRSKLVLPTQFDEFCDHVPQIGDKLVAISKGDPHPTVDLPQKCQRFLEIYRHVQI